MYVFKVFLPHTHRFFFLQSLLTHSRFLLDGCAFLASFHVKFVFICSICSPENGILWTSKKLCTFFRSPCINNHWICKWNAFVCCCVSHVKYFFILLFFLEGSFYTFKCCFWNKEWLDMECSYEKYLICWKFIFFYVKNYFFLLFQHCKLGL